MSLYKKFIPSFYYKNIFDIDYRLLKQRGIKSLFFDLDNTIIPNDVAYIDQESLNFLKQLEDDFQVIILSNNSFERVSKAVFGLKFIHLCKKPLKVGIKKALKKFSLDPKECACIGDQLFTDIFGGTRMKIRYTILVLPILLKSDLKRTNFNRKIAKYFINRIKIKDPNRYNLVLREYNEYCNSK